MRRALLPLLLPAALLAGCADPLATAPLSGPSAAPAAPSLSAAPGLSAPGDIRVPEPPGRATFVPYAPGATAITYDPAVVPPGATAEVAVLPAAAGVTVRLAAAGLVPRRAYGAHLHTRPCSAAPDAAGPHYQHRRDPRTPSVDPAYANPRNEVWLDFTADAAGAATVTAGHPAFPPAAPPRSLVLHAAPTRTAAGEAGTAGPRVACLTLPT
jgi:Cu-Zn family superoxide dismutase